MAARLHSDGLAWQGSSGGNACWIAESRSVQSCTTQDRPGAGLPAWGIARMAAVAVSATFLLCLFWPSSAVAQVFVVGAKSAIGTMPAFHPTNVELETMPLTLRSGQELIRALSSEQGFAARPLPMGDKGVVLRANGDLSPDANAYQKVLYAKGTSVGAGDRIVITKLIIHGDRIQFDLNGGPDYKHKYLRHVSIGMDPYDTAPVVQDDGLLPTGARVTLQFQKYVPEISASDVKALLAPVIDFGLKSPVRAYVDTLPPKIRDAILAHKLLVGMSHRMVLASMGQPERKIREKKDGEPYEEWIFGEPPQEVDFVRFTGDRLSRLEIAALGQPLVVRTQDETDGYSSPVLQRQVAMGGDPGPDHDSSQDKPPTLLKPGETGASGGEKPVQFPAPKTPSDGGSEQANLSQP